jgi:hypothetical protein
MLGNSLVWELVVLSAVYLIDVVVFAGLCRDEIRAWRKGRSERALSRLPQPAGRVLGVR